MFNVHYALSAVRELLSKTRTPMRFSRCNTCSAHCTCTCIPHTCHQNTFIVKNITYFTKIFYSLPLRIFIEAVVKWFLAIVSVSFNTEKYN